MQEWQEEKAEHAAKHTHEINILGHNKCKLIKTSMLMTMFSS